MLKRKKVFIYLFTLVQILSLVGCSKASVPSTSQDFSYTFTDCEGTTVELAKKPETVAILFSSYADIWVSAGGKVDITVNESVERGFADKDAIIVDPGTGHSSIDLETLVASKPDLVIGTADYDSQCQAVEFCRSAGIPSALFRVESFDDYEKVLKTFCDLTGKDDNYQQYGVEVEKKINLLLSEVDKNENPKKILFIRSGSSSKSTKAKTAEDNFACVMLNELETVNIAESSNTLTGTLSIELIVDQNPDYLFITTMGDESAAKEYMNSLLSSEGWRELDCVKNNSYYFLPKDLFHYKPNARWAEAYDYLASILYPETDNEGK